jgi:Mechanosensitive ion channel, conserved TM helix
MWACSTRCCQSHCQSKIEPEEGEMIADVDLEAGLDEAWENVVTFAPKLLGFFLILLIGFFIAKLLSRLTNSLLERVGFDGWVQRGTLQVAFERAKTDASDLIALIVFWAVFLITLQLAFGIWGPNPITDLIEGIIDYLPNVIAAVIILVIAAALARVVTDILTPSLGAVRGGEWIARGAGLAILVVGIFAALDQLEIAPAIVNGLFYALLVVVAGSLVVAFGGGGIPVARRYLERWSGRADQTVGEIRASGADEAARGRAAQIREDVTEAPPPPPPQTG